MKKTIKVVLARLGMDAHWRGSVMVARALRDAGMEVIYVGNQMPEDIVEIALQEDANVIGLSTLSGNHLILAPEVTRLLGEKGVRDKVVVLGGVIPSWDIPGLKEQGINEVFGPGTPLKKIVNFLLKNVPAKPL
jgi:methylmalonyl-CoA mutase C-terminal domain/subunit